LDLPAVEDVKNLKH